LHPADIALLLESLPIAERLLVWNLVPAERDGAVLLEVAEGVRKTLIADMDRKEILSAARHLDSDEIADLVPALPKDIVADLLQSLDREDRAQVQSLLSFPEGTVGALMDFDMLTVREDNRLELVLRYLRRRRQLPSHASHCMVVDRDGILQGLLPIEELLLRDPETKVGEVMVKDPIFFYTTDQDQEALRRFERYDLVSAPVVNIHHQLVGRLTVDAVMEEVREAAQKDLLAQVGLREEEDLFAPLVKSARNRWAWLAINLMTAFLASRVIGLFDGTIEKLVALASLMPIVASVGGNVGNQTIALVIRGLALEQIQPANRRRLLFKELGISLVNGLLWGSVMGLFTYLLYGHLALSLVMMGAMVLNLLLAACAGVLIPLGMKKAGQDPVIGSSVVLTAITDSMGFFIFLGLATLFLR
jgi:magnesium transporter